MRTGEPGSRRILILGWNHKAPTLLRELDSYTRESYDIDIISRVSRADRDELMERCAVRLQHLRWRQIEADFTSPSDLARYHPAEYESVLLLSSDWTETDVSTDARTILGYLVVDELLDGAARRPHILVELLDPDNMGLFRNKPVEVLVSPVVVSHILTQVALRRELHVVFEELLGPAGAEISFRPADIVAGDRHLVQFEAVQRACMLRGEIAIGLRRSGVDDAPGGVVLNPARDRSWRLRADDQIIVLIGP